MEGWNRFWFRAELALPAAICRILLGTLLLIWFIALAPNWERFYGYDGIMSYHDASVQAQTYRDPLNAFLWTEPYLPIDTWWWIGSVASLGLLLGIFTRLQSLLLYITLSSMIRHTPYVVNGEELVARMLLFYGIFCPWGHLLSLDAWLWSGRYKRLATADEPRDLPGAWAVRLMQINFLLIYMISLPYKLIDDVTWITGDALHWTVASDMWWRRGVLSDLTLGFGGVVRKAMTWGTLAVEGLFPLLVWHRRTCLAAVGAIVTLHLGIALMIPGVTFFTLAMVVGATLFVPGRQYQSWTAWGLARWRTRSFTSPHSPSIAAPPLPHPSRLVN